jgi:hypothetical protein
MSGTHLVAGDCRWGYNPKRGFPSEDSPATCRLGKGSPATCRLGKTRYIDGESGKCCSGKGTALTTKNIPHKIKYIQNTDKSIHFIWSTTGPKQFIVVVVGVGGGGGVCVWGGGGGCGRFG